MAAAGRKTNDKRAQAEHVIVKSAKKAAPMSFRIDAETRDLVDRAANAAGQNRTDFMLTTLRERAMEVLLNQALFALSGANWAAFTDSLDNPPPPNAKLRTLLSRVPAWDR
ncbi:MAG: DUF1778 domain-containing protein [Proteobacteria bacterium]|nr:DUF1778 domain-containing protein [Pseudomonadota bacterium]